MRAPSGEVRNREAQRLLEYGANLRASLEKETAKAKKTQAAAVANKGGKASLAPRRILPHTDSLSASVQGNRLR